MPETERVEEQAGVMPNKSHKMRMKQKEKKRQEIKDFENHPIPILPKGNSAAS